MVFTTASPLPDSLYPLNFLKLFGDNPVEENLTDFDLKMSTIHEKMSSLQKIARMDTDIVHKRELEIPKEIEPIEDTTTPNVIINSTEKSSKTDEESFRSKLMKIAASFLQENKDFSEVVIFGK